LYSIADPNWNVVAVANASGAVVERLRYDAFGKITWLDAAFAVKANSAYAWNRTFTGQVFDAETGLMLYRNRFYHTGLGRFVSRDPIGYDAGDVSLYRYVGNSPQQYSDKFGTDITLETGNDGSWYDVVNCFHQQVCVDDWVGCDTDTPQKVGKTCFSYREGVLNPLYGETYIRGPVPSADITRLKKTTCREDRNYASALRNAQYSSNFGYGVRCNCRTYSQAIFDDAPGTELTYQCLLWGPFRWTSSAGSRGTPYQVRDCLQWGWK